MMFAAIHPSQRTRFTGSTTSADGVMPNEHCSVAPMLTCCGMSGSLSIEGIGEVAVTHADFDFSDAAPVDETAEEFRAHARQHGVGQDRVDHPAAARELRAAARD